VKDIIFIGYGNPDRQDDGVAWHVMREVAEVLNFTAPLLPEDPFDIDNDQIEFTFNLQLVPEYSEKISHFKRVCFIDAHTGAISEEVRGIEINAQYQHTPFTHHMTPHTCLQIAKTVYHATPNAFLLSVRGYEFGFSNLLSKKTERLIPLAVEIIIDWYQKG
jgi:hydrogenase maturation protease